jgi:23S rRNA pseudouridine1911/1915/1917 synthase
VNGRTADPADRVAAGDVVEFEIPEAYAVEASAEPIDLEVVYEDEDLAVINKPAGMVVHPSPGHFTGTLVNALLGRGGSWSVVGGSTRPGIVHRLDKGTSGLMIVARTRDAHRALTGQLASRAVDRRYAALVWGQVEANHGLIDAPLGRAQTDPTRVAVRAGGREARTRYEVERRYVEPEEMTLLQCRLETGRTHQIRVHLAAIGHPVVGDPRYGGSRRSALGPGPGRQWLHARRLSFDHPTTGERLTFTSPAPPDLEVVLAGLA